LCGIAGVFSPHSELVDEKRARDMMRALGHRGPDGDGYDTAPHVAFCHTRLAILDLSDRAAQPMSSRDGRYLLSYNGEVYNFRELRDELEQVGVTVRSTGDTEVILEYIARFGLDATLGRLEGFWAIALWDRTECELHLVRDRHGIKPLYYRIGSGNVVQFASELKALTDGDIRADLTSLDAMLLGYSATWGEHTVLEGVRCVRAGEWLTFDRSATVQRTRYFQLEEVFDEAMHRELERLSDNEVIERVAAEFDRSIDYRMISDAPLACLVSGGVDSSLVASTAIRQLPDLALYHADVLYDSERPAADALARELGSHLNVRPVSDRDFLGRVAEVTWYNDLPLTYHLNSVPFYLVCQQAGADGIKVLLTGEGSDEFFLGYPNYAIAPYLETIDMEKRSMQTAVHRLTGRAGRLLWPRQNESATVGLGELVSRFERHQVAIDAKAASSHLTRRPDVRAHAMTMELAEGHLLSLLHRNDRLAMASGIESRYPFLGSSLVKLAANLPAKHKLRWTRRLHNRRHPFVVDKWAVRELAERRLPPHLARREKRGFPVNVQDRINVGRELLDDGFVADTYGLDRRALESLWDVATPSWILRLAMVEVWGRLFVGNIGLEEVQKSLHDNVTLD